MHRKEIINAYIKAVNAKTYVEIGVQRGHLFFEIDAPRKFAVDPNFMISKTNKIKYFFQRLRDQYYELTSDDFFDQHGDELFATEKIDVAFIDGLHTYEQVMRDVENCLKYLSPKGVILLHDCKPDDAAAAVYAMSPADARQRYEGWESGAWTGDVYKAIVELRSTLKDRHIFVFDTDHGVGCIQPGTMEMPLTLSKSDIASMEYDAFAPQQDKLLNLKDQSYLKEAISKLA